MHIASNNGKVNRCQLHALTCYIVELNRDCYDIDVVILCIHAALQLAIMCLLKCAIGQCTRSMSTVVSSNKVDRFSWSSKSCFLSKLTIIHSV